MDSSADKWQRYKEWLIEQTAAASHPVDAETLRRLHEEPAFPLFLQSPIEARAFMQNSIGKGSIGANRFDSWAEGLAFVENLYTLGAEGVYATNIDLREIDFDWNFPHADTLIMTLPSDPAKRRQLLDVAAAEASLYDGPVEIEDEGQPQTSFWWD